MVLIDSKKLLIVDDSPANVKLLRLLLSAEGHSVQTAESASEALEVLSWFMPDAILMDIQMPDVNGLQLTRLIKANSRTRNIMVLAVSANAMKVSIEEAYAAGCQGYITKPIDTRTFVSTVAEYLDRLEAPGATDRITVERGAPLDGVGKSLIASCNEQMDRLLSDKPPAGRQDTAETLHRCASVARTLGHSGFGSFSRELEAGLTNEELRTELLKLRQRFSEVTY